MLLPEVLSNPKIKGILYLGDITDKDEAAYKKYFTVNQVLFLPLKMSIWRENDHIHNFLFLRGTSRDYEILSSSLLLFFDFIYCTIDPLSLNNIDKLLERNGFFREETIMTVEKWGEAFYKRVKKNTA